MYIKIYLFQGYEKRYEFCIWFFKSMNSLWRPFPVLLIYPKKNRWKRWNWRIKISRVLSRTKTTFAFTHRCGKERGSMNNLDIHMFCIIRWPNDISVKTSVHSTRMLSMLIRDTPSLMLMAFVYFCYIYTRVYIQVEVFSNLKREKQFLSK